MIHLYSPEETENIAFAGRILADVFKNLKKKIEIGVTLNELDKLAFDSVKARGAEPAFLGYKPDGAKYPYGASICASLNDVIVHGLPSSYRLKSGDVLKLDFGVKYKGFYADAAFTVIVGKGTKESERLVKATQKALDEAIKRAKAGNCLGDIGWAIEKTARKFGFKAIKELTGHGIGLKLHEEPTIYNFGEKGEGMKLKPGMVLAIEPMLSAGGAIIQKPDESWATEDGSLSAHFEHTVVVTEKGPLILTK